MAENYAGNGYKEPQEPRQIWLEYRSAFLESAGCLKQVFGGEC